MSRHAGHDEILFDRPVTQFKQQGRLPHTALAKKKSATVTGFYGFPQARHKLFNLTIPSYIPVREISESRLKHTFHVIVNHSRTFIFLYSLLFFFIIFYSFRHDKSMKKRQTLLEQRPQKQEPEKRREPVENIFHNQNNFGSSLKSE